MRSAWLFSVTWALSALAVAAAFAGCNELNGLDRNYHEVGCLGATCVDGGADAAARGSSSGWSSASSSGAGGTVMACTANGQCANGFCVDGSCCDSACDSPCHACAAHLTGKADGTCAEATDGTVDPRGSCASTVATTCGTDGSCQAGACRYWPSSVACPSCSNGVATDATCTGTGTCAGPAVACAPYACGATACNTSCAADGDCAVGAFCWQSACANVRALAAGGVHTCALTTGGGVQCWGGNASGQLGNGSNMTSLVPVAVLGLGSGVTAVAAGSGYPVGDDHTCALTTAGAVLCWGCNSQGQLGVNSTTDSKLPVPVLGLTSGVKAIAVGLYHTCALTTAGAVLCWGYNYYGEVGNGTTTGTAEPSPVVGLPPGIVAISTGFWHTCALTSSGGVMCWGINSKDTLGNGTSDGSSAVPVQVSGLTSGVARISAGAYHTCAVTTAGAVLCWGYNGAGQLGNGTLTNSPVPVPMSGYGSGVAAVAAGYYHTCGLTTAGAVWCVGDNGHDQLGNVGMGAALTPVPVTGLDGGVASLTAGDYQSCVVTTAGAAVCWGEDGSGQLGNGSTMPSKVPVPVTEP